MSEGNDVAILFTGTIGYNAKLAARQLEDQGISVRLVSFPTVKPLDTEMIARCAQRTGALLTVEEHNLPGGFGSAVAEVLLDQNLIGQVKCGRMGLPDVSVSKVGTHDWLRDQYGLGVMDIVREAQALLGRETP